MALVGVARLNISKCRLHSAIDSDFERRDVVRASAVGAVKRKSKYKGQLGLETGNFCG